MLWMANGIVVVDEVMDRTTSVLVNIILFVGRSYGDVVARCICSCLLVCCFLSFV